jgi:hypothetical protein
MLTCLPVGAGAPNALVAGAGVEENENVGAGAEPKGADVGAVDANNAVFHASCEQDICMRWCMVMIWENMCSTPTIFSYKVLVMLRILISSIIVNTIYMRYVF